MAHTRLVFCGRLLNPSVPLWSFGVRNLHTVEAQYRLRGGADGAEAERAEDKGIGENVCWTFALLNSIDQNCGLRPQIYCKDLHMVCGWANKEPSANWIAIGSMLRGQLCMCAKLKSR
jgi:hypothetical protein